MTKEMNFMKLGGCDVSAACMGCRAPQYGLLRAGLGEARVPRKIEATRWVEDWSKKRNDWADDRAISPQGVRDVFDGS